MKIAATGHRPEKLGGYDTANLHASARIARQYLQLADVTEVVSGMAQGWDTAVALAALSLGVPLVAAIPFKGQESKWPEEARKRYFGILRRAKTVYVVSTGGYHPAKMQARNEFMVDYAAGLLAAWDGSDGGTRNCIDYAILCGKPFDNVWGYLRKELWPEIYNPPRVWNTNDRDCPDDAVGIMRGSPYGNPFKIGRDGDRAEVIRRFECETLPTLDVSALRGKHLECCCKPLACHGDSILRKANA